jgi:hypothetical protein
VIKGPYGVGFWGSGIADSNVHREDGIKLIVCDGWCEGLCASLKVYEGADLYLHAFTKTVLGREQTSVSHPSRFTPEVMCLKANVGLVTDIMYLTLWIN